MMRVECGNCAAITIIIEHRRRTSVIDLMPVFFFLCNIAVNQIDALFEKIKKMAAVKNERWTLGEKKNLQEKRSVVKSNTNGQKNEQKKSKNIKKNNPAPIDGPLLFTCARARFTWAVNKHDEKYKYNKKVFLVFFFFNPPNLRTCCPHGALFK